MKRVIALLLALALCAALPAALAEENKTVVATFYPIYCMAANLLADVPGATLASLTPPTTGCLHDQALLPADLQTLDAADVLLMNGAGMESYLDDALSQFPDLLVVDASQGIALLPAQEHHDEHDGNEEHDHGEYNAHLWMSVPNAMQMVRNLCAGLVQALPEQQAKLEANRDAYLLRLEALDQKLREGLAPYVGREMVTFHEAFAYFAQEYGLTVVATFVSDPEDTLSAGEMAVLAQLIPEKNLPPLFIEPAYECPAAELLSQETGVAVYTLDPATTGDTTLPQALTAYEAALEADLAVLTQAFTPAE